MTLTPWPSARPNRRDLLAAPAALALARATPALAAPAHRPSNPTASVAARRLHHYLWSIYGRHTLTGQQESPSARSDEIDYLRRVTGRAPAILGLDFIDPTDWAGMHARAVAWHRDGGIVTLCWHWGAPDIGTGYENSKRDFDLAAALVDGTPGNRLMLEQMDAVAGRLAWLRDAGVPVLWRPFHEFSGDWFWWGKHGPVAFRRLWTLMHDRFSRRHGLDNLLWVLGWAGQNVDPAYDPGRHWYDIAGADLYVEDHGNLASLFAKVRAIVGKGMPICLHENGPVPDPALLGPDADWLWFMTWHTRWLEDPAINPPDRLARWYGSERYVTRDELPWTPAGPRPVDAPSPA